VASVPAGRRSAWAQYAIETPLRDALKAHLQEQGIPSVIYYVKPLHLQKAYANLGCRAGDYPVTERLASEYIAGQFEEHTLVANG
jgi:dTDP-4-amino-4,6-dideoxygalactose transaminase